jgi:hypothetical protein
MNGKNNFQNIRATRTRRLDSVDDEIEFELDLILRNPKQPLYKRDRYKHGRHTIDILSPKLELPVYRHLIKTADQIRFLISMYPEKKDLEIIDRILFRPRHIEAGGVELMALFLRSSRALVYYLHIPHTYDLLSGTAAAYNEFTPFNVIRMVNRTVNQVPRESDMQIPSLLYVLSMITPEGNGIDKFFAKIEPHENGSTLAALDEISEFYTQHGY